MEQNNTLPEINDTVPEVNEYTPKKGIGSYIGWLILSSMPAWLPLIGYIVVIILAFSGKDPEKKKFFKASFILHTICVVFLILILIVVFGVFGDQIKPFISANY